jgi:hypothetical protein
VTIDVGDRMDRLVAAAVRQGWVVWQTDRGGWMFRAGNITVHCPHAPTALGQWQRLMLDLIRVGLVWPPPPR